MIKVQFSFFPDEIKGFVLDFSPFPQKSILDPKIWSMCRQVRHCKYNFKWLLLPTDTEIDSLEDLVSWINGPFQILQFWKKSRLQ